MTSFISRIVKIISLDVFHECLTSIHFTNLYIKHGPDIGE